MTKPRIKPGTQAEWRAPRGDGPRRNPNVSLPRARQGYYDVRRENDADKAPLLFMLDTMRATLKEVRYAVPGHHLLWAASPQSLSCLGLLG
jgi:hypothetical protein